MQQMGQAARGRGASNDNFRILRYLAKLTINPAVTHGISHDVGSLEPGKLADIVLWPIGVLRRQAEDDHQGRPDRLERHGRPERLRTHL